MRIDAPELFQCGKDIRDIGVAISGAFERIANAWDQLHLGWSGRSEQEAKAFSDTYLAAVTDFFGEEGATAENGGKVGLLSQFAGGLMGAGNAYAQTESSLTAAFRMFGDALLEVGPPDGDRNNYIPDNATWDLPADDGTEHPEGFRDTDAPPVSSNTPERPDSVYSRPWFTRGQEVEGDWTWVETREGPHDLRITVHDGAIWNGVEGPGVEVEWIDDETGEPVDH
ncbi:WXG100 family type VII secretion target [Catenuloplanes atrovinosus]|uniref:WXG100 family type VII secretion target n=1 Tax=Catenuloplanes atrovinosus TaxID=137266 RepID=A0AAE3YL52_9ACTN|nr:WXG100 family type VII secretion target [Catenuloplanes atrovinosus]MDR7274218.1 hypothetical protein [Catenuloplanes atrovinosus]